MSVGDPVGVELLESELLADALELVVDDSDVVVGLFEVVLELLELVELVVELLELLELLVLELLALELLALELTSSLELLEVVASVEELKLEDVVPVKPPVLLELVSPPSNELLEPDRSDDPELAVGETKLDPPFTEVAELCGNPVGVLMSELVGTNPVELNPKLV